MNETVKVVAVHYVLRYEKSLIDCDYIPIFVSIFGGLFTLTPKRGSRKHAFELSVHPDRWMPWKYTVAASQNEHA